MADCEFLSLCPFFNDKMENMSSAADMMKKLYFKWRYSHCAMYTVVMALGRKKIPSDLFPGDAARAEILLTQYNYSNRTKPGG
jgi:hypothetical protein